MVKQSYQEVSKIILEEIVKNSVDFNELDFQTHFYLLKQENPEKYERLLFDTNGHTPYCDDLSSIFFDFKLAGYINRMDNNFTRDGKFSAAKFLVEQGIDVLQ